jgi:hypothetical protein
MKKHLRRETLSGLLGSLVLLLVRSALPTSLIAAGAREVPPYHRHPPNGPVPSTLDPVLFQGNRSAYVAYSAARQIRELLYQEPCFCECNEIEGHESLLDCFVHGHGEGCVSCQSEAMFCFTQQRKGKNAKDIRKALMKGDWTKFDVKEFVKTYEAIAAAPK